MLQFEQQFLPSFESGPVARVVPFEPERPLSPDLPLHVYDEVTPRRSFWNQYAELLDPPIVDAPVRPSDLPLSQVVVADEEEDREEEEEEPSEFLKLCRELVERPPRGWTSCAIDDGYLIAVTDLVLLDDEYQWDMGQYTISMTNDLYPEIDDESAQLQHPHYERNWCWGNLLPLLLTAQEAQDPGAVLAVLRELLGHYNPADCYHKMGEIDNDYPDQEDESPSCYGCGDTVSEDDEYHVDTFTLCDRCGGYCEQCEEDRWQSEIRACGERLTDCHCDYRTCTECCKSCHICDVTLCEQHDVTCEGCSHSCCGAHRGTCHDCSNTFCSRCLVSCDICHQDHCADSLENGMCTDCKGEA
jgi:hypothetical protein